MFIGLFISLFINALSFLWLNNFACNSGKFWIIVGKGLELSIHSFRLCGLLACDSTVLF